MNTLQSALARFDDSSLALGFLLAKITVVLAAAWVAHAALHAANPRWRVLLWRTTAVVTIAILLLHAAPPLVRWGVLPAASPAIEDSSPRLATLTAKSTHDGAEAASQNTAEAPHAGGPSTFDMANLRLSGQTQSAGDVEPPAGDAVPRDRVSLITNVPRAMLASEGVTQAETAAARSRFSTLGWLGLAWGVGCIIAAFRLLLGELAVRRIIVGATPVPEWLSAKARQAARRLACRSAFEVLSTEELASPCLVGVLRPVVLVPARQCRDEHRHELSAILAHEIAHLAGGDMPWNQLLNGLSVPLWFHPLCWRTRAAHAAACDRVADAVAAHDIGDVVEYGRTLARLAVRTAAPARTVGLAMARVSDVRDRIESLERKLFSARLGRTRVATCLAVTCLCAVLLGGLAMTRSTAATSSAVAAADDAQNGDAAAAKEPSDKQPAAQQLSRPKVKSALAAAMGGAAEAPKPLESTPATSAAESPAGHLFVHVTDADGDAPLADAHFHFHGTIGGKRLDKKLSTDAKGIAILKYPADKTVGNLWMTCDKEGFVPQHYVWRSENKQVELQKHINLRLVRGITIGGVVHDEEGHPIADAKVELTMPVTWPKLANYVFHAATPKTDTEGRWSWTGAPAGVPDVGLSAEHPDYMINRVRATSATDQVLVLKRGLQVAGCVTDAVGQPVAGAAVRLGFDHFGSSDPETKTDDDGRYVLKKCKPGKSLVTVQKDGFTPQFRELTVGEHNDDMSFQLAPGHVLRIRVVDGAGKPIPKAHFCTDTWRGYRTLSLRMNADEEGRIQWRGAPADEVLCDVLVTGYMSLRRVPLTAADEEQTVTVYRPLVISGKVTDARTGKPLPNFRVQQGQNLRGGGDRIYWSRDEAPTYTDGQYSYKFSEPAEGHLVQITADGYRPATSKVFKPTDGEQTFDVALQPGTGPAGIVVDADGNPAAGAEVALATKTRRAFLRLGQFDRSQNQATIVKCDEQGHFRFPVIDEPPPYAFIVVHQRGVAQLVDNDGAQEQQIELAPWGQIDGQVRVGRQPDPAREISYQPPGLQARDVFVFSYGYDTKSDAEGRFHFNRVIPGSGTIGRVVVTEFLSSQQHAPCWITPIEVRSGETSTVTIGGTGRPVSGQLVLDRNPGFELNWTTNEPATIEPWDKGKKQRPRVDEHYSRYMGNLDRAGRFTIPDVPAGSHRLKMNVNNPPRPNACGAGSAIGEVVFEFDVPDMLQGRSDEPLDLGTITAKLYDTLDVGEVAPDFIVNRLDEGALRLSELKGKLVLVDFWATWCGPCLTEMPALSKLHQEFGADPRFVMVGISCDNRIDEPREYVQEKGFSWLQAHTVGTHAGAAKDFGVLSLPTTFLIAPDGHVLAKDLRGGDLKKAITQALSDEKLFPPAKAN